MLLWITLKNQPKNTFNLIIDAHLKTLRQTLRQNVVYIIIKSVQYEAHLMQSVKLIL